MSNVKILLDYLKSKNAEKLMPIFYNWETINYKEQKEIVRIINSNSGIKKTISKEITKAYHTVNEACGPSNNPNWNTYNKCDSSLSIDDLKIKIKRGEDCINLRKSLWFINNDDEYPFGSNNKNHTHPIKDAIKYLNQCKSLLNTMNEKELQVKEEAIKAREQERNHEQKIAKQERELRKKLEEEIRNMKKKEQEAKQKKEKQKEERNKREKERNPVTGRMVLKCSEGYERDPKTGKCRKKCKENQVRDPKTGRCKKY